MAKTQVTMKINGKTVEALVEPRTLLIYLKVVRALKRL